MRLALRVFRCTPGTAGGDGAHRWQAYEVEAGADTTVLDALVAIQREQDPTLAFRWACRVGMCGSCAMVVNGRERWACRMRVHDLGRVTLRVRPLYHFPVLRDLVVDMAPFNARLRAVDGAFRPRAGADSYALVPGGGAERRAIDVAIECIGCGMCLSACTMVAHDPRFPGPAALNRAFTLQRDSREGGAEERWPLLLDEDALTRCHGQGTCTDVCPMGLSPTDSILKLRRAAVRRAVGIPRGRRPREG
ncbi:MAG: succinate dehydrogenase/fumarate reductase iron-sulfur subunit [Candidatus Rokubacteria bacterium]|nr:succinate dehydrogenase/fumarate reductase iron-sulfur subunit [Candidatus Rokubacteria bacterium]MBI3826686.1 succinate dehydrogenase/fumarate reductase iron-sulfur subunit [Candidatus Rokubacteria bacterium]